ncbi:MAG: hemerythrin domain-containing protein [Dehalococcoidales bacterium]|nr:hemerythrin domain-containing protein [Dehalococcoidales bacterium]
MVQDKSCPGSLTIREPIPEYINCPNCSTEVEIWTDELKATCSKCGEKVYRAQQASCIDWCPHAKECVGPEVYARLKPGETVDVSEADSAVDVLKRDHDRVLETLRLLRGANLCLKLGTLTPQSAIRERGIEHLAKVLDFFDKDLKLHFRREEEILFPALEKHIGQDKSPTTLLLKEHEEVWNTYDQLKEKLEGLQGNGSEPDTATTGGVEEVIRCIDSLLTEHIKRENESLFPLAAKLLNSEELETTKQKLRKLSV